MLAHSDAMDIPLTPSLLLSSLWIQESTETKIVWITLLLYADKDGVARIKLPSISHRACVSIADTDSALQILSSPDQSSEDQTDEGRRIREVDDGWAIVGFEKYLTSSKRTYMRNYMRTRRNSEKS